MCNMPCFCPDGVRCDSITGKCLCPPGFTGDQCQKGKQLEFPNCLVWSVRGACHDPRPKQLCFGPDAKV